MMSDTKTGGYTRAELCEAVYTVLRCEVSLFWDAKLQKYFNGEDIQRIRGLLQKLAARPSHETMSAFALKVAKAVRSGSEDALKFLEAYIGVEAVQELFTVDLAPLPMSSRLPQTVPEVKGDEGYLIQLCYAAAYGGEADEFLEREVGPFVLAQIRNLRQLNVRRSEPNHQQ